MKYIFLFLLGLCLGSFINALVWRLHKKRDWVKERSECPKCGHVLKGADLIPVISWIMLAGRCRYCHKPIEDSPLVELLTPGLFVLSSAVWPDKLVSGYDWAIFGSWLVLLTILIALALYDHKHMLLPNKLIVAAAVPVAAGLLLRMTEDGLSILVGSLGGLLAFGGLFYVLFQVSKGKWIGGGDVKLGFVLGVWLADFRLSFLAIFLASFSGTLVIGLLAARGKTSLRARFPFGPLLIAGTIAAVLYGQRILDWYTNLIWGF